jgi:arylsulfatase
MMNDQRPNIILIMTDQQRFDTIQAWGDEHMITPNMDRLVAEGVSFRQAYCPGATCVASRAATFTGMYAHNTGAYSFLDWADHETWVHDLSANGYFCANIGKMHFIPTHVNSAFDERIVVENPTTIEQWHGGPDDDWGQFLKINGYERPNHRQDTDPDWLSKFQGVPWHLPEAMHSDVFIGNSAVAWVNSYRGEKPFFLEVGFTGPHEPWDPLQRHFDLYKDKAVPPAVTQPNDLDNKPPQHKAHKEYFASAEGEAKIDFSQATDADIENMRRHYYAKITTVDEQLGHVMDALEEQGFLENSLIIFCSDHGEMLGDHTLPYKWLMYDPIVHVPMIIKSSSQTSETQDIHELVSLMDIGPTILEAAGIDIPTYLEGQSLLPYLYDDDIDHRDYVICEDNYLVMLRSKTHKLVYYIGQDEYEFYDLQADPNEFTNLWQDEASSELRNLYLRKLLDFLAKSNYFTNGYKRTRQKQYQLRWHDDEYTELQGPTGIMPKPKHL